MFGPAALLLSGFLVTYVLTGDVNLERIHQVGGHVQL